MVVWRWFVFCCCLSRGIVSWNDWCIWMLFIVLSWGIVYCWNVFLKLFGDFFLFMYWCLLLVCWWLLLWVWMIFLFLCWLLWYWIIWGQGLVWLLIILLVWIWWLNGFWLLICCLVVLRFLYCWCFLFWFFGVNDGVICENINFFFNKGWINVWDCFLSGFGIERIGDSGGCC